MADKYFLYSDEQIEEKNKVLAKTFKKFSPGIVTVGNRKEKFTQLSDKPDIPRFVDTKVVAYGDLKNFAYKMPENIPLRS